MRIEDLSEKEIDNMMEIGQNYGEEFCIWLDKNKNIDFNEEQKMLYANYMAKVTAEYPALLLFSHIILMIVNGFFKLGYRTGYEVAKEENILKDATK